MFAMIGQEQYFWKLAMQVHGANIAQTACLTIFMCDSSGETCGPGGVISRQVEEEVKQLTQQALNVAKSVIVANMDMHSAMSRQLESAERLEGKSLQEWLNNVVIPEDLRSFVQQWQK